VGANRVRTLYLWRAEEGFTEPAPRAEATEGATHSAKVLPLHYARDGDNANWLEKTRMSVPLMNLVASSGSPDVAWTPFEWCGRVPLGSDYIAPRCTMYG